MLVFVIMFVVEVEVMKVKVNVWEVRNQFHFGVQLKERAHVFKSKKAYTRKSKHKCDYN